MVPNGIMGGIRPVVPEGPLIDMLELDEEMSIPRELAAMLALALLLC